MPMNRRTVLRSALAALGGAGAAGCTDQNEGTTATDRPTSVPSAESSRSPSPVATSRTPNGPAAEVGHGPRSVRKVALTFHGNGDPALARTLLDQVERAGARISVFVVGTWLVSHPEMAQRILQGKH